MINSTKGPDREQRLRRRLAVASLVAVWAACGDAAPARQAPGDTDGTVVQTAAGEGAGSAAGEGARPAAGEGARPAAGETPVAAGVDVLLDSVPPALRGARLGLITNHTGRTSGGTSTIDALHAHPDVRLAALFAPEHGLRGDIALDSLVVGGRDPTTDLPVHTLYGGTDRRKPTAEMLAGLDALAFDIQDIGARPYTYVWTMALAMEAAAEAGLRFVVLDRPNPIGGVAVQGPVQDASQLTFVGLHPVPLRHGLTPGELARYLVGERGIDVRLVVIPVRGWGRTRWFDETGLAWRPPSPNMPSLESAAHYPGTVLLEGTNLSVGRGTDAAFQQVGAPWLDADRLAAAVRAAAPEGVRVEPVTFTPRSPQDGKYPDQPVHGVRLRVTDRATYDPVRTGVGLIVAARAQAPERFRWTGTMDRLIGSASFRAEVEAGWSAQRLARGWAAQEAAFRAAREPYLLYPDEP